MTAASPSAATPPGFLRSGHLPTLVAALLYFDVSFMVWVILGPLAPFLREDLALTATLQAQYFNLISTPTGSSGQFWDQKSQDDVSVPKCDIGFVLTDSPYVLALCSKDCTDLRYHVDNEAVLALGRVSRLVYDAMAISA